MMMMTTRVKIILAMMMMTEVMMTMAPLKIMMTPQVLSDDDNDHWVEKK